MPLPVWLLPTLMGAGAGAGIFSSIFGGNKEKEALEQQKKMAWAQYELGKGHSDAQYALSRGEALAQADIGKRRLDEGLNQSVDQFNLGLLSQAYGIQNAQIQTASNTGASLAAEGMSGTRGGGGGALMRAYEEASLGRNVALQKRSDELSLAGMLGQATNAAADIRRERESWDAGGYRYAQKEAQDAYNLSMAQLGQSAYDWQIDQAGFDWKDPYDWLGLAAGGLQGASSGLSLWNSWNYASQFTTPKPAAAGGAGGAASPAAAPASVTYSDPGISAGLSLGSNSLLTGTSFDNLFGLSNKYTAFDPYAAQGNSLNIFSKRLWEF